MLLTISGSSDTEREALDQMVFSWASSNIWWHPNIFFRNQWNHAYQFFVLLQILKYFYP